MKDKKIAIYLVITIIVFAIIIGVTVYMVSGKKTLKGNNVTQQQSSTTQNVDVPVRTIEKTYENSIYSIDLYTDGTATARVKSNIQLWGELETSQDENYKKEKNEFKNILSQSRQIDSNNRKIEDVFISKYIGNIYNNYNYGKAIIKCEGNLFYLIDLVSDKKIRIAEDWTEKCREVNREDIELNLENECLAEVLKNQMQDAYAVFEGTDTTGKYMYSISYKNDGTYAIYIFLTQTQQLDFYGLVENKAEADTTNSNNNVEVAAGTTYYKFSLAKPNGGSISGTIKQTNIVADDDINAPDTEKKNDIIINKNISVFLELTDISSTSENYSTKGYIELGCKNL